MTPNILLKQVGVVQISSKPLPITGGKHGKVDQKSAPLNVNLEVPLESDHY
jgi:hypothetical protein